MAKRIPRQLVIPVSPALVERINECAAADKRSRKNWVVLQLEKLTQQASPELPEERAA
jgi:hypothetical protein